MGEEILRVGIGDLKVAKSPNRIMTVGLGSCVGISIYDKINKIGGLAHIMLPCSNEFRIVNNPMKFADLAIPLLVESVIKLGAKRDYLRAKIAGGASMFNFSDKNLIMDIGNRNSAAVKTMLRNMKIRIVSEDLGGNKGRTITFDTDNGMLSVKTVGLGIKQI